MKVQTLGDISSLTSCSLFGSLSTNHWARPQEVAICGHHGDRVCGWALELMCYLEQMKYDPGEGGRKWRDGQRDREECSAWKTKSRGSEKQEMKSQAASLGEGRMKRDEAFAPALCRTQGSAITRALAAGRSGRSALASPSNTPLPRCPPAPHQHPLLCSVLTDHTTHNLLSTLQPVC
ncbi:unnamed protein product [Pleuronectes platessa]|uniref:Uncharacterized protein n=1 Tax=Pleuronectes platessa TaxID=8262 RepID=A0A9N7UDT2_PLEPL|nr:unnamed protein product [Pleuronectes platessa]